MFPPYLATILLILKIKIMLNQRYLFLLLLLSTACFKSSAQDFNFYIGANLQSQSIRHRNEATSSSITSIINDSMAVRTFFTSNTRTSTSYETTPGFSAGINYRKKIGNRWAVMSGIGINTGKLKVIAETNSLSSTILGSDTISYVEPQSFLTCDEYINIGEYKHHVPIYN
jgi:hypothetical protein